MAKYIVEHMEEEMSEWCIIEYRHMAEIVGKENLIITNIPEKEIEKLKEFGTVYCKKVSELIEELGINNACILDPASKNELVPEDHFENIIFGGILGDYPPKKRTGKLTESLNFKTRNLGDFQMTTDTAVLVTKKIVDGKKLDEMKFMDDIEIEMNEGEAVQLPFRYLIENEKPILPDGLLELLDKEGF